MKQLLAPASKLRFSTAVLLAQNPEANLHQPSCYFCNIAVQTMVIENLTCFVADTFTDEYVVYKLPATVTACLL